MGAYSVILLQQQFTDNPGFGQVTEQEKVKYILAIDAVEAFDTPILGRLTWFNEIQYGIMSASPALDRHGALAYDSTGIPGFANDEISFYISNESRAQPAAPDIP